MTEPQPPRDFAAETAEKIVPPGFLNLRYFDAGGNEARVFLREHVVEKVAEGIRAGLRRAAEICYTADKSAHPADLGKAIESEAGHG